MQDRGLFLIIVARRGVARRLALLLVAAAHCSAPLLAASLGGTNKLTTQ